MKTKSKILILVFVLIAAVIGVFVFKANATEIETVGDIVWAYEVVDGYAVNVRVKEIVKDVDASTITSITVPGTLGGHQVKSIGGATSRPWYWTVDHGVFTAYYYDNYYNRYGGYSDYFLGYGNLDRKNITEVILPEGLEEIGVGAFQKCENLTSINLPSTTKKIYASAFVEAGIEDINLDDLRNLELIDDYAFYKTKLSSVKLPDSVTEIKNYAFSEIENFEIEISDDSNLEYIGTNAFRNTSIEKINIPNKVKRIGEYAFDNVKTLKEVKLGNSLETIGKYAFYGLDELEEVELPDSLKEIGEFAFGRCSKLEVKGGLNEGLESIGEYAFSNCSSITEINSIPDSVTAMGINAFDGCSSIEGEFNVGNGVTNLPGYFVNNTNISKLILGTGIVKIDNGAVNGMTDVWVKANLEDITIGAKIGGEVNTRVHTLDEMHRVNISVPEGVLIKNADTNEELVSGDYVCSTVINYIVETAKYSDKKIIISGNTTWEVDALDDQVKQLRVLEDTEILVALGSNDLDLSVHTYLSKVNNMTATPSKEPIAEIVDGKFTYTKNNEKIFVKQGDKLIYGIRVYNESSITGNANEITVTLPAGFVATDSQYNEVYNWENIDGKMVTRYLANHEIIKTNEEGEETIEEVDNSIKGFFQTNSFNYKEVFIEVEVVGDSTNDEEAEFVLTGSVTEASDEDPNLENNAETESVFIEGKIRIDYALRVVNIDDATNEKLIGAEFALFNESDEEIKRAKTGEDGTLDFGMVVDFGEGKTIYYIKQTATPEGYGMIENNKAKITVTRHVTDAQLGLFYIEINCEFIDYDLRTDKYNYIPIYTAEQFRKIGSGESVEVDGQSFDFNLNAAYKLYADIELNENELWEPLDLANFDGIINGDGHSIKNLTITGEQEDGTFNGELGLFSRFSGVIDNLKLENVNIENIATNNAYEAEGMEFYYRNAKSTKSGHEATGAFAAVMYSGTIQNCEVVSGKIKAVGVDNVGGLVGHTMEGTNEIGRFCKFVNNKNSATILGEDILGFEIEQVTDEDGNLILPKGPNGQSTYIKNEKVMYSEEYSYSGSSYVYTREVEVKQKMASVDNVGGIVGCALASVSIVGCENDGTIQVEGNNQAGIIGYAEPRGLSSECNIKAKFDNADNVLTLVVRNKRIQGEYELKLENKEVRTLGLIPGAVYSVYDKDKNAMEGFENIVLETGSLKVANVNIAEVGTDTYYIEEVEPAEGYEKLKGSIKVEVIRYWDGVAETYKVAVNTENLSYREFNNSVSKDDYERESSSGLILNPTEIEIETLAPKMYIENCINKGIVLCVGEYYNNAGIIGRVNTGDNGSKLSLIRCINEGEIAGDTVWNSSYINNTGGIIAKVEAKADENQKDLIYVNECINRGKIIAGHTAGGIIGNTMQGVEIYNSSNEGDMNTIGIDGKLGGILGNSYNLKKGTSTIINCKNSGTFKRNLENTASGSWASGQFGGIIADNLGDVVIKQCVNEGEMFSYGHGQTGGMIGSGVGYMYLNQCENRGTIHNGADPNLPSSNKDTGAEAGGMIGYVQNWCYRTTDGDNNSIDTYTLSNNKGARYLNDVQIYNCANYASIDAYSHVGGLVGGIYATNFEVSNCKIGRLEDEKIHILNGSGDTAGVAGLVASINVNVSNCDIINVDCNNGFHTRRGYTYGATGGVIGNAASYPGTEYRIDNLNVTGCNVIDCNIESWCQNAGGIVAETFTVDYSNYENNKVLNSKIINNAYSSTYVSSAAILGVSYCDYFDSKTFKGNLVDNCYIAVGTEDHPCTYSDINIGGITGGGMYIDVLKMYDNKVINSHLIDYDKVGSSSSDNVGGILAFKYSWKGDTIELVDNLVDNCLIESNNANTGGVIGMPYGDVAVFDNNIVSNSVIDGMKEGARGSVNCVSGMVAGNYGTTNPKNCKLLNTKVYSRGEGCANTAFICALTLGGAYENVIVDNCEEYSTAVYGSMGGIGGIAHYSGWYDVSFENCQVINSKVTYEPTNSVNDIDSGLLVAAYAQGMTAKNCLIKDNEIKIVLPEYSSKYSTSCFSPSLVVGSACNDMLFEKLTVKDNLFEINETKATGLLGSSWKGLVTIKDLEFTNNIIRDTGTKEEKTDNDQISGGLVGYCTDLLVDNVNMKDITISGADFNMGGIAGHVNNTATIKNITIDNLQMENRMVNRKSGYAPYKVTENYQTAGLVGGCSNFVADNVKMINSSITAESGSAAGLNGISYGNSSVSNITMDNVTVINKNLANNGMKEWYNTDVSAVCSVATINLKAEDISLSNISLKSNSTKSKIGGIAGYVSEFDADNILVQNLSIENEDDGVAEAEGDSYGSQDAGFVIGNMKNGTIDNVIVDKCNMSISGGYGFTGSVAGYVKEGSINNAMVRNNEITMSEGEGYSQGAIGGITGFFGDNEKATMSNVNATELKMNGASYVGGIVGFAKGNKAVLTENIEVSDLTMDATSAVGGIVGAGTIDINNAKAYKVNANAINFAGGIIGLAIGDTMNFDEISEKFDVIIRNSNVEDSNIVADRFAGGIVGLAYNIADDSQTEKDDTSIVKVIDCSVIGTDIEAEYAGGIAGNNVLYIENSKITGIRQNSITGTHSAGGILGLYSQSDSAYEDIETGVEYQFIYPKLVIDGCVIENMTIECDNYDGMILGHDGTSSIALEELEINNTVK